MDAYLGNVDSQRVFRLQYGVGIPGYGFCPGLELIGHAGIDQAVASTGDRVGADAGVPFDFCEGVGISAHGNGI